MSTEPYEEDTLALHAADGTPLQAHLYRPLAGGGRPVLISGGLGIPQRFYAPFARWLAGRGHLAMTFAGLLSGQGAAHGGRPARAGGAAVDALVPPPRVCLGRAA